MHDKRNQARIASMYNINSYSVVDPWQEEEGGG